MEKIVSIIIPVYNESESLELLYDKIRSNVDALMTGEEPEITGYEVWFVDDGSTDGSDERIRTLIHRDDRVHLIQFRRNCGKSRALQAGFRHAGGDVLITMDADLQDDPDEIPNFLRKLDEGYDLVSGWKQDRQDPLEKRLPSKLFNRVTSAASGVPLHDFNCGFKAYRREVAESLDVYGEFHRYIPVLASRSGFLIAEIPVVHHKREFGRSKYGMERYLRGLFDSVTTSFLLRYSDRPMYWYGRIALILLAAAAAAVIAFLAGLICGGGIWVWAMLVMAAVCLTSGVTMLGIGLAANLLVDVTYRRNYQESHIREII